MKAKHRISVRVACKSPKKFTTLTLSTAVQAVNDTPTIGSKLHPLLVSSSEPDRLEPCPRLANAALVGGRESPSVAYNAEGRFFPSLVKQLECQCVLQ
jgi:hypothetical protein